MKQLCALRDAEVSLDEAQAAIEELIPKTQFLVACDTLENLLKGGRLSADQVKNASLLNIKPIFTFNETGVLVAFDKAKGMRGVIKQYVQNAQKRTEEQGKQRIRFCHVANEQGVEDLRSALDGAGVEYVDEGSSLVEPRWQLIWVWVLSASHLLLLKPKAGQDWAICLL